MVCALCGARRDAVAVVDLDDGDGAAPGHAGLRCDTCGGIEPFRRLPLYCVTGPSGTGKSTVARLLVHALADRFVVLEQDVLWVGGLRDSGTEHPRFRSTWLRMVAMIHQSGRPAVLCGMVVPPEFESLPERRLFSDVHYLALTCRPDVLAERLRARPAWREWDEERIAELLDYAAWIDQANAELSPPMTLLDTTDTEEPATAGQVAAWIRRVAG